MKQPNANISRFPVPELDKLPEDLKDVMLTAQEKMGFIPNVYSALAHRPGELRGFLTYVQALMNKESGLTVAEKEAMILAFSGYNGCVYCVQSHGAKLRVDSGNSQVSDQVAINYREADITPRQKAIIEFAMKETKTPAEIGEADFDALREHGLSDEDIWDVAAITAFFNMSNRMMTFLAVRPDDEFYMMGRK
ncbi:peroxidase-related enzyme [Vibrio sp. JC009]|uniref:peroxidase-related enzyme n=1 Tax=Vibrio sp. JC009 TaxID=2912314 RepID=UPI0023B03BA3|nr:peroxidase-related enzyme [Vibrio sp. JC009]WED23725.1 peroxidase-related enzyme [Vibrio sp. JC009]